MKRLFDVTAAAAALVLLLPVFLAIAMLVKSDSRGPVFFRQWRIGRHYRPFSIYKFRTMRVAPEASLSITPAGDARVTRVGRFLRAAKIDELPQLLNILAGDMSVVGPRPEVLEYVTLFHRDYGAVLTVRPGLTDLASIKYRDEAALLAAAPNPDVEYVTTILPDKIALGAEYVRRASFWFDLALIARTLNRLAPRSAAVR